MKTTVLDRASLCNVVLLGLFALGLGLAFLMVRFRAVIELSGPVELPGEGLSVAVPVGTGWRSLPKWTYERDNSFTLVSAFAVQGRPVAEVRWQVRLAERPLPAEDLLKQYADRFAGQAGEIQCFESDVVFYWMHLFPHTSNEELLLAAAGLDNDRVLLLQLRSYAEPLFIRELFEHLAASVQIHSDPRREAGKKLSADLANRFYSDWLEEVSDQPPAFLIRAAGETPLGYSKTTAVQPDPSDPLQTGVDYQEVLRGSNGSGRTAGLFRAAEDLSEFVWTCTRTVRRRVNQTSLHLQPDGFLEIQDSYGRRETIRPAPGAVPEILLPALARALLDSDQPEAIVDVISSAGWIVPALLSQLNPLSVSKKIEQTQYAVKVDFLHNADNFEEYYFDEGLTLFSIVEYLPGQNPQLWNRAKKEEILFYFRDLFESSEQSASRLTTDCRYASFRANEYSE